jgi:hypothetical protein
LSLSRELALPLLELWRRQEAAGCAQGSLGSVECQLPMRAGSVEFEQTRSLCRDLDYFRLRRRGSVAPHGAADFSPSQRRSQS